MRVIKLADSNVKETVKRVASVLRKNGLVVLPSDTAYGLAANASSSDAVQKVYDFKGRLFAKGLSVFLNNLDEIEKYAKYNQPQWSIIKTLLPGPFTVILESKGRATPAVEPGDGTLGVRVVDQELISRVTQSVPFPITATSANLAGKGPHFSIRAFLATLSEKKKAMISLVVDAGTLPRRPTSTVIRLAGEKIEVLREGSLNLKPLWQEESKSEAETQKMAQKLLNNFLSKDLKNQAVVVVMKGDLGAGKTVFAKGIGEQFGLSLTSPTFVLMDERPVNQSPLKTIYHLDLFRINEESELLELKLGQFLKKGNLILIEWGEKLSVFEKLKTKNTTFYLLQIEDLGINRRKLSLYQI
jgi:L-threonylcarbamoyladenylate synthase